ncbi:MAG TPA: hypothetical protein VGE74_18640, partial [Gemmata sp.]
MTRPARPSLTPFLAALIALGAAALPAAGLIGLSAAPATAQPATGSYTARVTQVDRSRFPNITIYVSITDAAGNPVSASADLEVEVLDGDKPVHRGPLFTPAQKQQQQPTATSVALVLDCSGSMAP